MDKEKKSRYFDEVFDILSNAGIGRYSYWADYESDEVYWSKDAVDFLGLPSQTMKTEEALEAYKERIHPEDLPLFERNTRALFLGATDQFDVAYRIRTAEGDYVTCSTFGRMIRNEQDEPDFFTGSILNHEQNDIIDPTTGLRTRKGLLNQMKHEKEAGHPYFLMTVGIRNFYTINNTYGYVIGNKVLHRVAEYAMSIRGEGEVYRTEGTKFIFCLDARENGVGRIQQMFRAMRNYLKNDLVMEGHKISLDICGGLIYANDPSVDVNTVYVCALFALSKAKAEYRKELCIFNNELINQNKRFLDTLDEIRESVVEEYRGFYLYYQPIIAADTGKLCAMEALLRWKGERAGNVPPSEFIEWLEKDPLFYDLGNWIIRQALTDAKPLIEENPNFVVNINIAYTQLQREDFNEDLMRILEECEVKPKNVRLELTERCKLLDPDFLKQEMKFIKEQHMQVSLDDFATGYSAMNLLFDMPVDQIKIDRTFLINIQQERSLQMLLKGITDCARELSVRVCVEGVEDLETLHYVREKFYCTSFQGYYFSKPVDIHQFMEWKKHFEAV